MYDEDTNIANQRDDKTQPMTQQTPFESLGPIDSHEPEPHTTMNRFEKLDFLQDTTAFKRDTILKELVGWLTDDDFDAFYESFCSDWDICKSHEELDKRYGAPHGS